MKFQTFTGPGSIGPAIDKIHRHELDVALVKGIVSQDECTAITKNFQRFRGRHWRGDNVPGYIAGATHYGKTPQQYFSACDRDASDVGEVFAGTIDPLRFVYRNVAEHTQRTVRPSRFANQHAYHARIVEWVPDNSQNNDFLLQPHEDISQVDCDRNAGWEIRHLPYVIAMNFYASVRVGEGKLRVYDYAPERADREAEGLAGTGYPYRLELLHNKSFVELAVEAGDLAILRGNNIHAVTSATTSRIVVNGFLADVDGDFVYWT